MAEGHGASVSRSEAGQQHSQEERAAVKLLLQRRAERDVCTPLLKPLLQLCEKWEQVPIGVLQTLDCCCSCETDPFNQTRLPDVVAVAHLGGLQGGGTLAFPRASSR